MRSVLAGQGAAGPPRDDDGRAPGHQTEERSCPRYDVAKARRDSDGLGHRQRTDQHALDIAVELLHHATAGIDEPRLIGHLRDRRIATLAMLQCAGLDHLMLFDEDEDALSPPNRLLLSFSRLHEYIKDISNTWAEDELDVRANFSRLLHAYEDDPPDAVGEAEWQSAPPSDFDGLADENSRGRA